MGQPIPSTSNGAGPSSFSTPPSNGHASNGNGVTHSVESVTMVQPNGTLMYEDDRDWAEHQELHGTVPSIVEDDLEDGTIALGESSKGRHSKNSYSAGKRMPVEREEVVRLMLQGLRDIGYQ